MVPTQHVAMETALEFDYIIVGAGSAGCVLANRLSHDADNSVLLVEAGPVNKALTLKMPAAVLSNLKSTQHNWAFQGEPEPELNSRTIQHDRGRTLGGSSSINGMVFIRGHVLDFEGWRQAGCEGWSYADVLPYFKSAENYSGGETEFRGGSGPMNIQRSDPKNPLALAFLKAGVQAGYPRTDDINGFCQEGFGTLDSSVHNGERWSSARAYLDPARKRANLTIVTNALTQRVVIKSKKATGVVYKDHQGQLVTASVRKEVILSAGAVGSPHLLMLSGIGPANHLRQLNIPVIAALPGVGQNLNDHPDFVTKFRCLQPISLWPKTGPLASTLAGLQWLATRKGICASNHFEVVGCVRSDPGIDYPDLQFTMSPIAMDDVTWNPLKEHAFQIHVGLMRAHSRGWLALRDANPATPPRIQVNYLQDPRDRRALRQGIRFVRDLVNQPAFTGLRGEEIFPGASAQTDAELDAALNTHTTTQWHLSGTARMGSVQDQGAVVDPSGRVHGISSLRVVDASIMPTVTNGNTNSPTIMIAEKLSDAILGRPALPRSEMEIWKSAVEA